VEFIAPLARIDPIYKEEEESFKVGKIKGLVFKGFFLEAYLEHLF